MLDLQGEVVVIPAGCAHQVVNGGKGHNIKVAQDFVAPESAAISLELLDEVCSLSPFAEAILG